MDIVGAFLIGFFATMLGAISTGANLITIPGLMFLGASPFAAVATSRPSAVFGGATVAYRYHKAGKVIWRYVPILLVVTFLASLAGPKLLLQIPERAVEVVVGLLLIACLPLLFIGKGRFGEERTATSRTRKMIGLAVLFVVMMYSTAFVAGGGVFLMYTLTYFFGLTITEGNATGQVLWGFGALVALVAYAASGQIILSLAIPMLIGAVIGGAIGTKIAIKKGVRWVKYVLTVVIIASSAKLLFF